MTISNCRLCGSTDLISVVNLGTQSFTGIFPKNTPDARRLPVGLLELVLCNKCTLVQLSQDFERTIMYGNSYGYRSGLNQSMIDHLHSIFTYITRLCPLSPGDVVLDIGSNDGTLLGFYPNSLTRVGIDPTSEKYSLYYQQDIIRSPSFFSEHVYNSLSVGKSKVITSISMFYDLPNPLEFACHVKQCLHQDGVWLFEQSYLPSMLRTNSYDTICHEHVEYYSLSAVKYLLDKASLKIVDISFNKVNGGSFSVVAAHAGTSSYETPPMVDWLLSSEKELFLHTPTPYREFESRIYKHRDRLTSMIDTIIQSKQSIYGLGASTKGNVLLQFCGLNQDSLPGIGDVNPDKYGCFTPGTLIPIIPEEQVLLRNPEYLLILPWHFRSTFDDKLKSYIASGGKVIYPLPDIELV